MDNLNITENKTEEEDSDISSYDEFTEILEEIATNGIDQFIQDRDSTITE